MLSLAFCFISCFSNFLWYSEKTSTRLRLPHMNFTCTQSTFSESYSQPSVLPLHPKNVIHLNLYTELTHQPHRVRSIFSLNCPKCLLGFVYKSFLLWGLGERGRIVSNRMLVIVNQIYLQAKH